MPQLSLYIDEDTLRKIEVSAKMNKISISKFVSTVLKEHLSQNWPDGFGNLFGSISDDSFAIPVELDWSLDDRKESL